MLEQLIPRFRLQPPTGPDGAPDWSRVRKPVTDRDRVILSTTHLWLRNVPTPLHPKRLCRYYPHVANRLAEAWDDVERTDRLFDELLNDRRGKRRGFPERITLELQKLERFHARRPRFGRPLALGERLRWWVRR
ncbi:MAG: hypothetical protein KIT35_26255 [Piscinibacter sp.]|uniref:hypothetical protein n=1 Tax=Piscinibacter TaxID=1114981 RepID=UPI000FDE6674|nr:MULTISPECIES: hypothetical protein [Piscinibacter]MCW5667355.1 hypothetical protein [Piscinibacter sp.]